MYGAFGMLRVCEEMFAALDCPAQEVWGAMLSACVANGDVRRVEAVLATMDARGVALIFRDYLSDNMESPFR